MIPLEKAKSDFEEVLIYPLSFCLPGRGRARLKWLCIWFFCFAPTQESLITLQSGSSAAPFVYYWEWFKEKAYGENKSSRLHQVLQTFDCSLSLFLELKNSYLFLQTRIVLFINYLFISSSPSCPCPGRVRFPVLSQIKPQAPLPLVPTHQFL